MSIQLIVFPQSYNGLNSLSGIGTEFVIDGIDFLTVDTSSTVNSLSNVPNDFITAGSINVNTWYRYSMTADDVDESLNNLVFTTGTGIAQRLSNLSVGQTYDIKVDIGSITGASGQVSIKQFVGTSPNLISSTTYTTGTSGVQTSSFVAQSTSDTLTFTNTGGATSLVGINSISVKQAPSGNSSVDLSTGQVILDLYEMEDMPLTLSVDEFKNAAEQVKSYSKAFKLPATKRNNQIFNNIFEITRADDGVIFNPYVKTKCIINQDGFTIFEGFLRLIDIQDKDGEVSYNINLYSEVIALADVLGERTFSDLNFSELDHTYNKTNIKNSWNNSPSAGITYTSTNASGFRDDNDTLKYPFVDWTHQLIVAAAGGTPTEGNPELTSFEQVFRPFIQLKYLIQRIFNQPSFNFTYTSDFIDSNADFGKLYMDFNWGDSQAPLVFNNTATGLAFDKDYTGTDNVEFVGTFDSNFGYDTGTHIFTAVNDNQTYVVDCDLSIQSTTLLGFSNVNFEWVATIGGVEVVQYSELFSPLTIVNQFFVTSFSVTLNAGDTLQCRLTIISGDPVNIPTQAPLTITTTANNTTSNTLLQTLRGELKQWEFLKGIFKMFNLISIPDKSNPTNIIIEPYKDIFLSSNDATKPNFFDDNSTELNWTEKVDIQEMKLTPLTNLNKTTMFKFVEDDDDYPFQNYKNLTGGHLYGSMLYDASISASGLETILEGEEEIIPEPFAATVVKSYMTQYPELITPAIYKYNADDQTSEPFDNSPRVMYNNGIVDLTGTGISYFIPSQNGTASENAVKFLQFSHLSAIPTVTSNPPVLTDTRDFHFGVCQLLPGLGSPTPNNLFNMYWLPYFNELYNADTRIMTMKVNLGAGDMNTFNFYDVVMIKNRKFRVNKIDYKPNDLATVEFILIP